MAAKTVFVLGRKSKAFADAIASLTHAVGTADGTVDDVTGTFDQTILNNNFKELTTKVNAILVVLRDAKLIVT